MQTHGFLGENGYDSSNNVEEVRGCRVVVGGKRIKDEVTRPAYYQ